MMKDVPSDTKKKIEFLLEKKKKQHQNDEGRAIGNSIGNLVSAV